MERAAVTVTQRAEAGDLKLQRRYLRELEVGGPLVELLAAPLQVA